MNAHPDDPQDPLLSRLYRELPDEAPSADTDAALRAAARRAVGAGPGRRPAFVAAHWRGLGATAAALLLGVGLTLQWRAAPHTLDEALAVSPAAGPDLPAAGTGPAADAAVERSAAAAPVVANAAPGPAPGPAARPEAAAPALAADHQGPARVAAVPAPVTPGEPGAAVTANDAGSALATTAADAALAREQQAEAATVQAAREARSSAEAAKVAAARRADTAAAAKPAERAAAGAAAGANTSAGTADSDPYTAARKALAAAPPTALRERREAAAPAFAPAPAPAAPAAVVAAPDYREALAGGRYAEALAQLPDAATAAAAMDRLLLRWQLRQEAPPACDPLLAEQQLLCEGLRQLAAGTPPDAAWRRRLAAAGLDRGDYAYRRALLAKLFGPAP